MIARNLGRRSLWWGILGVYMGFWLGLWEAQPSELAGQRSSTWGVKTHCAILGSDSQTGEKPNESSNTYIFTGIKDEVVLLELSARGGPCTGKAILVLMDRSRSFVKVSRGELPNKIQAILPQEGEYLVIVQQANGKSSFTGKYCLRIRSSGRAWQTISPTQEVIRWGPGILQWAPQSLELQTSKGSKLDVQALFNSQVALRNLRVNVSPRLKPFLKTDPVFIRSVSPQVETPLEISVEIPRGAQPGLYTGEISLKRGRKTLSQGLPVSIQILDNLAPMSEAGQDQLVALPEGETTVQVRLYASGSYDPDGTIVSYIWTGTPDPEDVVSPMVTLKPGIYDFTLQVTDDKGATALDSVKVTVLGPPVLMPLPEVTGERTVMLKGISLPGATILLTNSTTGETKEILNENGLFEVPFDLASGLNEFEVIAKVGDVQSGPAKLEATYAVTRTLHLDSISPSEGQSGSIVTLTGSGFTPDTNVMGVHFIGSEMEGTGSRLEGKGLVLEATETSLRVVVPFIFLKSEENIEVYVYDGYNMSNSVTFHVITAHDPTPGIKGNEAVYQLELITIQLQHIFHKLEQWTKPNVPPETWALIEENIGRTQYFLDTFKERVNSIPSQEVRANLDAIFGGELFSLVTQQLEQTNEVLSHTTPCDIARVIEILEQILEPINELNMVLDGIKGTLDGLIFLNWIGCITVCQPCCLFLPILHEVYSTVAAIDSVVDAIRSVFNTVINMINATIPTIPSEWKIVVTGPFPGISNHIYYTNTTTGLSVYANFTNAGFEQLIDMADLRIDIPDPWGVFSLLGLVGINIEAEIEEALGNLILDLAVDLLDIDQIRVTFADIRIPSTVYYVPGSHRLTIQDAGATQDSHIIIASSSTGWDQLDIQAQCGSFAYPHMTKCLRRVGNTCLEWGTDYPRYFDIRVIERPELFPGSLTWKPDEKCYEVSRCYDWERREHVCTLDQYRQYIKQLCLESGKSQTYCNQEICYDSSTNSYDPMCNLDLYYATLLQWCNNMPQRCDELIGTIQICQEYGHWDIQGVGFSTQRDDYCGDIHYTWCYDRERQTHICNSDEYKNIILNICRNQENATCNNVISHCCLEECMFPSCNLDELHVALFGVCAALPERCQQYMHIVHRECADGPFFKVYWNGGVDTSITGNYQYDSFNLFSTPELPSLKPGWLSIGVVDLYGNERRTDEIFVGPSPNLNAQMDVLNGGIYPGETLYIAGNFFSSRLSDNRLTIWPTTGHTVSMVPSSGRVGLYTSKDLLSFENMEEYQGGSSLLMRLKVGEHLPCGSNNCDEATISMLPYQKVGSGGQRSILHGGAGSYYIRSVVIGDLNGDQINDLVVGVTDYMDPDSGYGVGAVFIKFGPIGGISGPMGRNAIQYIDLSHPQGGWDVKIIGDPNDRHEGNNTRRIGNSLAIGDIDGDGIGDLIMGTTDRDEEGNHEPWIEWTPITSPGHIPGKVYVIYGKIDNWQDTYMLGDAQYDLKIYGDEERELGYQVAVGNITSHREESRGSDLVITAPTDALTSAEFNTARVYIISGFNRTLPHDIKIPDDLTSLDLAYTVINSKNTEESDFMITDGEIQIVEYVGDGLGKSVAVGDVNGDGISDVVLGAPHYSRYNRQITLPKVTQGAVYVLLGRADLSKTITADPDAFLYESPIVLLGPTISSDMSRTGFASSVAIADLDHDGRGEIIIGAPKSDLELTIYPDSSLSDLEQSIYTINQWPRIGTVYIIDGSKINNFSKADTTSISDLIINGSKTMRMFGYSLATGDINNDGIQDLLVGAPGDIGSRTVGRVWVLYGNQEPRWRNTRGYDTIHLEHRRWYVTPEGMTFDPRNSSIKIEEGADTVFIGDVLSVDQLGIGFGISMAVGDLDPFVGDDVVVLDRFGRGPEQANWSIGPGAAYVFYQTGDLWPLTIRPETVNMNYCDSEQTFTVSGGLAPYQFKWNSCWQTYIGQPPFQIPGEVLCSEDFPLPNNFEATYGENSVLLRINGCVPNDLKELWLRVYDSPFHGASASRQVNFLKPEPDISVSPTSIDFGDIVGNYKFRRQTIEVTNTGQVDLQINSIDLTGSTNFSQTNDCPNILPASDYCTVTIEFRPTSAGLNNGTLTIRSNDPDEEVTNVGISANVIGGPDIQVIPTNLEFPEVPLGSPLSKNVTITNMGISELHISEISITGTGHENIEFGQTNNCSGVLSPGASCVITVTFTPPNTYMAWWATLSISSDDSDEPQVDITLSGYGIPSALSLSPQVLDMGDWMGSSPLYITNESSACVPSLNWEIAGGLPSWLSVFPTSGTVTSCGGAYAVTVQVDRSGLPVGVYRHTILVNSNSGSGSVEVRMSVAPFLSVTPVTINFEEARKRLPFTIRNTSDSNTSLNWNIAADLPSWLTASQMSGVIPAGGSATVYLYANRTGLHMDQTYTHTLSITSNGGDATIPVSLSIPIPLATFAKYYGGDGGEYFSKTRATSDGGFIAVGLTNSFGAGPLYDVEDAWVVKLDSSGYIEWERTYGGYWYSERAYDIRQTSDGGFILVAGTSSFTSDRQYGLWILKLDSYGDIEWEKEYGGWMDDNWGDWGMEFSIQQTGDYGYIVAGHTYNTPSDHRQDVWVLKLDSSGNIQWQKTYGGSHDDYANSLQLTLDGGYIIAGATRSFNAEQKPDMWVLKLDSSGNIEWQKAYEGTGWDLAYDIHQTNDGGYILIGYSESFGSATILRLDPSGNIQWQKIYGGWDGYGNSIKQTQDGGYIFAGSLYRSDRGDDIWVVKLDPLGDIEWQKTYGGSRVDVAYSVEQTSEGDYILAGYTNSFRSDRYGPIYDAFVLKIDSVGNIGDSCGMVEWTNIVPEDTNIVPVDTSITSIDSSTTTRDTHATVIDSLAVTGTLCSETEEQAEQKPLIDIDVFPMSFDFTYWYGDVIIGQSVSQLFTVRNTGYQLLNIINILFSGSQDFSATHNCPPILNVARGCEITVYFAPSVEGPQGAYLSIESNDPDEGSIEIPITGSGIWGECPPEECPSGDIPPPGVIPIGGE